MDPGVNSRLDKRESQSPIPRPAALARRGSACDRPARYDPEKISPPPPVPSSKKTRFYWIGKVARPEGFEPPTFWFVARF